MNSYLKSAWKEEPKLKSLSEKERGIYKFAIELLGITVGEKFLDLPPLPQDKYSTDGLYYSIPYLDDERLCEMGNAIMLLVVYQIENGSSCCPLRIDFKFNSKESYSLIIYDQSGQRTEKRLLFSREEEKYFSEIKDYQTVLLSELMDFKNLK